MTDLDKLILIYWILDATLKDIADICGFSDYDVGDKVEDVFKTIDDAHADIRRLIKEMENKQ